MSLEDDLAARKGVILRRKVKEGQQFKGSAEIKKELSKVKKATGEKQSKTMKARNPMNVFQAEHGGLTPDQYQILLDKGLTLEDLDKNKDGTVNKRFLSGPKSKHFKNRMRDVRSKHRKEGLPEKSEKTTNDQPITASNPMGSGLPVTTIDIKGMRVKSAEILETAEAVASSGVDFESIPGFYNTKYSPEMKIHALTCYIVSGSFSEASKFSAVPEGTIRNWRKTTTWWPTVSKYIQQARQEELDVRLSGVIHKTLEVVADRLEDGDYKYNPKLDKCVRVPVPAIQAAAIADKAISNRNLLRGDPTSRSESSSLAEQIQELKVAFKGFRDHKVIEVKDEH